MKKALIVFTLFALVALALPIIGNSFMQNTIKERINELESYGLRTTASQRESSYLYTSEHIEFVLEDTAAFEEFVHKYADSQLPVYIDALLKGVTLGVDIEYSNLFFSKALLIEIYPTGLSKELSRELLKVEPKLHKHIENFFQNKGLLYHIEYDTISQDFHGYIKDIKEHYLLEAGGELFVALEGLEYEGNGELIAPNRIAVSLKRMDFKTINRDESVVFHLNEFSSAASYESKSTYLNSFELEELGIEVKGGIEEAALSLKDVKLNSSSNTQGKSAELYAKSSLRELTLNAKNKYLHIKNFNLDTGISKLSKDDFKELLELASSINSVEDFMLEKKIEQTLYRVLSEGFLFNIADLSVEALETQKGKTVGGLKLQSQLELKKDKDFAQKLQISPLLLLSNIALDSELKLSKEIYQKLIEEGRGMRLPQEYMLEDKENYIFNLRFRDGVSTLNGKTLQ